LLLVASILLAQDTKLQFEVASVRPSGPVPRGTPQFPAGRSSGGPGTNDPQRITYERVPLLQLLMNAYGVSPDQIAGPGWATTDDLGEAARFDISAKLPAGATKEQATIMLQNLLAERLQLTLHRKTIEASDYALLLGKGGSKLKESTGPIRDSERKAVAPGPIQLEAQKDGFPELFPGHNMGGTFQDGVARMRFRDYPLVDLAQQLSQALAVRIVNQTGLSGKYDFKLEFDLAAEAAGVGLLVKLPLTPGQPARMNKSVPDLGQQDALPIISSAMEKQLGLKLQAIKVPIDTLVIDHVEKTPTEN